MVTSNWSAVMSLAFGMFGLVTTELLPIGLIAPMAVDLGVSDGAAGQAITATAVAAAIAGPLVVLCSGRIDRQKVVWMLGICFVGATLICAIAPSLSVLLAARALLGASIGGTWALVIALAMRLVPAGQLSAALAVIFTGVSIATVIAPPLGAWLSDIMSWRAAFMLSAGLAVVSLVGQLATIPKLPTTKAPSLNSFKISLSRPAVLIGLITVIFVLCGNTAGISFLRSYLEDVTRIDVQTISMVLLTFGVAGFVGNMIGGSISSRSPASAAGVAALASACATFALASQGQGLWMVFSATAIWGLGYGAFPVAISSWNAKAAPDQAESAGAVLTTGFQVAIAGGAVLGGSMIEAFGSVAPIHSAGIATATGAGIMLLIGRRSEKRRAAG